MKLLISILALFTLISCDNISVTSRYLNDISAMPGWVAWATLFIGCIMLIAAAFSPEVSVD